MAANQSCFGCYFISVENPKHEQSSCFFATLLLKIPNMICSFFKIQEMKIMFFFAQLYRKHVFLTNMFYISQLLHKQKWIWQSALTMSLVLKYQHFWLFWNWHFHKNCMAANHFDFFGTGIFNFLKLVFSQKLHGCK